MKQASSLWQWAGFGLSTLGGTLLHFLYDWTGGSILAAPFSGVNESTWEHMKLLFWPLFLFALVQRPFFKDQKNYWCVKLAEILLGLLLIPVLFYTYNGAFGKSPDWVNIAIFYVSAAAVFVFEWGAFKRDWLRCTYPGVAFVAICLIGILFVVFTFLPPGIPLFQNPQVSFQASDSMPHEPHRTGWTNLDGCLGTAHSTSDGTALLFGGEAEHPSRLFPKQSNTPSPV